jgi:hypothetical protein
MTPRPPVRSAEAFWNDFRARAAAIERDPPARAPHPARWSALAAVVLAGAALWSRLGTPDAGAATEITSLTVDVPHSSVFVLPLDRGGVLVWVGMEEAES